MKEIGDESDDGNGVKLVWSVMRRGLLSLSSCLEGYTAIHPKESFEAALLLTHRAHCLVVPQQRRVCMPMMFAAERKRPESASVSWAPKAIQGNGP